MRRDELDDAIVEIRWFGDIVVVVVVVVVGEGGRASGAMDGST